MILSKKQITKALIRLQKWAGWSAPVLFANPRRQVFSRQGPYYMFALTDVQRGSYLFDKFNNTRAQMLDSIYHMAFTLL